MNMVFNELQEYVDYVENHIVLAKKRNHKNFATFDTKFSMPVIAHNAKEYFEKAGYEVRIHECKSCKFFDLIFSWSNE